MVKEIMMIMVILIIMLEKRRKKTYKYQDVEGNIARGTTDPGYWLFNLSYLSS